MLILFLLVLYQIVVVTPEKIFPRDADEDEHGGVEDMTRLVYLNEPGVLYNIRRRYALNDIYVSLYCSDF
jgi:myosin-5